MKSLYIVCKRKDDADADDGEIIIFKKVDDYHYKRIIWYERGRREWTLEYAPNILDRMGFYHYDQVTSDDYDLYDFSYYDDENKLLEDYLWIFLL